MFIFLRLLLAHFLGDFPLQFNTIYKLKFKGIRGILPHACIVAGCCVVMSWPYLDLAGTWLFILFIGVTHLLQDSVKLSFGHVKYSFWAYLLDQLFHVAMIAAVFLSGLKNLAPPVSSGNLFVRLYNSDALVLYLIAILITTYNGFYLIRSFNNTFFGNVEKHHEFEKWYGMLERAGIVTIFFIGGYAFLVLVGFFCVRPLVFRLAEKRFALDRRLITPLDTALSWVVAILTGIGLYLILKKF